MTKKNFYSILILSFGFFFFLFCIKFFKNYSYNKQTYFFKNLNQKNKTKEFIANFYDYIIQIEGNINGYGSNILYFKQPFVSDDYKKMSVIFLKKKTVLNDATKKKILDLINKRYNISIDYEEVSLKFLIKYFIYLINVFIALSLLILFFKFE